MSETFEKIDGERLLSYIERIERLEEEKKALQNDIKEVLEEAKTAVLRIDFPPSTADGVGILKQQKI